MWVVGKRERTPVPPCHQGKSPRAQPLSLLQPPFILGAVGHGWTPRPWATPYTDHRGHRPPQKGDSIRLLLLFRDLRVCPAHTLHFLGENRSRKGAEGVSDLTCGVFTAQSWSRVRDPRAELPPSVF